MFQFQLPIFIDNCRLIINICLTIAMMNANGVQADGWPQPIVFFTDF